MQKKCSIHSFPDIFMKSEKITTLRNFLPLFLLFCIVSLNVRLWGTESQEDFSWNNLFRLILGDFYDFPQLILGHDLMFTPSDKVSSTFPRKCLEAQNWENLAPIPTNISVKIVNLRVHLRLPSVLKDFGVGITKWIRIQTTFPWINSLWKKVWMENFWVLTALK